MKPHEIPIRLVIIDPTLELEVLTLLENSNLRVTSRHLVLNELEGEARSQSVVITTSEALEVELRRFHVEDFYEIFVIGSTDVAGIRSVPRQELTELPGLINHVLETVAVPTFVEQKFKVLGVTPRAGATLIDELLEEYLKDSSAQISGQYLRSKKVILCSEVDDFSVERLFQLIEELSGANSQYLQFAVILNKVPRTKIAAKRVKAIEQELMVLGVSLVCSLYFDEDIQVIGKPTAKNIAHIRPAFDWIAKAN